MQEREGARPSHRPRGNGHTSRWSAPVRGTALFAWTALVSCGGGQAEPATELPTPEIELATRIRVVPGVELILSHGAEAPRPAQVRALAEAAARILADGGR